MKNTKQDTHHQPNIQTWPGQKEGNSCGRGIIEVPVTKGPRRDATLAQAKNQKKTRPGTSSLPATTPGTPADQDGNSQRKQPKGPQQAGKGPFQASTPATIWWQGPQPQEG